MPSSHLRVALVSNATGYAGPAAVTALLDSGFQVFAQDPAFADEARWERFRAARPSLMPIAARSATGVAQALLEQSSHLDVLVSNDHYPATALAPDSAPIEELTANIESLLQFPFELIQALLPTLRAQGEANIVMITSNRTRLPLSGGAFPDAARAAANALVRSLAIDCARDGIVVNAVAPNFLYSEAYYPKAVFEDTEVGREHIRSSVPLGRLAKDWEIGELIVFLATVKTRFLTGAVVDFAGGWPFGQSRPTLSEE